MPIYEYECQACGHEFEEWQKMSDPPVKTCPKCKKRKVQKLISKSSFHLKGGGWYSDLYSSSDGGKKPSGDEKGEKDSASKSESKSDEGSSSSGSTDTKADQKADKKADKKADNRTDNKTDKKADKKK